MSNFESNSVTPMRRSFCCLFLCFFIPQEYRKIEYGIYLYYSLFSGIWIGMAYSQAMGGALGVANSFIDLPRMWIGVCVLNSYYDFISNMKYCKSTLENVM